MSQDIKKSLLVTLDFPPNLGGVATFYYNVCRNLPGDKIVVLAPEIKGAEEFDKKQSFTIIRKNLLPKKNVKFASTIKWMSIIKDVKKIVKQHKIELIQAGQVLPIGTLSMWNKKKNKIPYIFYAHGLDITLPQKFRRKKILLKNIIRNASSIVANSYFTKDELVKLGAKDEQVIVVNPCPSLKADQSTEWRIEELKQDFELKNKKVILTVGRIIERKGHDMVIKALPEIIKSVPDMVYVIVGSGPYKKYLEKLVNKKNLGNHVVFTSSVSQNDLASFFDLCDLFIMPSRQLANGDVEGFGIVYLEANLFGKPVIGGKSGGVPEAIINGKTGLLVDPNDSEDIAEKTIKLLTDTAYAQRLGMQGLERVTEEFDWEDQVDKIKEILG